MAMIQANIQQVRNRITKACHDSGRPEHSVTLLVVSKTFGSEAVREAFAAGAREFGENYVQEALEKIRALADCRSKIHWHLIGPLQSNKTRVVAENFDWVHTIDRFKIAERLSAQRPVHCPPLQICLQVNISEEPGKAGLPVSEVLPMAEMVSRLPQLRLRGLMSIPQAHKDPARQAVSHRRLRELLGHLRAQGFDLDTLSMGMSADLSSAIEQGATIVRVGSAIFGTRQRGPDGMNQEPLKPF